MKLIKLFALIMLLPVLAAAQGRTAERAQDAPFSQLTAAKPNGSIRNCINCQSTTPCTSGGTGAFAMKINGVWSCSDLTGTGGEGGAPTDATYITRTPDNTLSGELALSTLATGLLKNATGTGIPTIAVAGTDYLAPNGNGSALTNLNASALSTGTVPDGRFPAVLPAASATNLTNVNALNISGVIPISNLATGTPTGSKFIRDDGTLQAIVGGGDALTANPLSQFAATTSSQLAGVLSDESGTSGGFVRGTGATLNSPVINTPTGIVKGDVGLGNVDNTSDATKNAATVTLTNKTISGTSNTLTNLPAANISGVIPIANLATGTPNGAKFIRDDGTLQAIPGGGDALVASPLSQFAATTSAQLAGVITNETGTNLLVYSDNPVLVTPTIASFLNAGHDHANAVGGGQLTDAALSAAVSISKGGHGQTTQTAGFNALDPLTTKGDVLVHDGTNSIRLAVGSTGDCLKANSGTASGLEYGACGSGGSGDFVGPASATDNAVVRFDTTTGKLGQNSVVTIDDSGNISTTGTFSVGSSSTVAGTVDLAEGTTPALVANTVSHSAVVDVPVGGTQYLRGATASSGLVRVANSAGVMTVTHDGGISHLAASTSASLAGVLSDETGSGPAVFQQTPTIIFGNTLGINIQDTDASHVMDIALGSNLTAARTFTITPGDANRTLNMAGGNLTLGGAFTTSGASALTLTTTGATNVTLPTTGTLAVTVASGTSALGTSAIASGACATVVTTAATGTATTDTIGWGFNGDPTAVTGYQASVNGMLTIIAYPSANNVNFLVCNNTAASVTPGAVTLNWRVGR